jgi:hypothetical protein
MFDGGWSMSEAVHRRYVCSALLHVWHSTVVLMTEELGTLRDAQLGDAFGLAVFRRSDLSSSSQSRFIC